MRTSAQTRCPFCAERIASDLHVCPFCESNLAPRRSRVTLVKPERSARAAVITSSIGIAFLLGVALLHSLHETRPSARIPNQSVASAATPVRHNTTQSSVLPKGWQYYSAENGAYELVNKELPYRGDASASDWGCQGVGAANPDAPSISSIIWNDAISFNYLNQFCHPVDASEVPQAWRESLASAMKSQSIAARNDSSVTHRVSLQPVRNSELSQEQAEPGAVQTMSVEKQTNEDSTALDTQINQLTLAGEQTTRRLQQRELKIARLTEELNSRDQEISLLKHNLEITEQDVQRNRAAAAAQASNATMTQIVVRKYGQSGDASSGTEPDPFWPNVPNFYPALYKANVKGHIYQGAGFRLAPAGASIETEVSVRFFIEKSGTPTDIQILSASSEDNDTIERTSSFIKTVGPFQALVPENLNRIEVEANLVQQPDKPGSLPGRIEITKLEISALGNRS